MTAPIPLTDLQAEEVGGLLDVIDDEGLIGWGTLTGKTLVVTDPDQAAIDLEWRAQYLVDEGAVAGQSGAAGARSLRALIKKIREGVNT